MDKPEDIPQDVWDRAMSVPDQWIEFGSATFVEAIARAILKAKNDALEAAAMTALAYGREGDEFVRHDCGEIAQAIRNLKHEG